LLHLDRATIRFGGLTAVGDFSLSVQPNELVGLIGPNGAGKTTAFNMITGVYQPTAGTIHFGGRHTAGIKPHDLTKLGIARTFQNIRLFGSLSVLDNVRAAMQLHCTNGIRSALMRGKNFHSHERGIEKEALELLDIFDLGKLRNEDAKSLPYGDQRRLEIVRALATKPKLLLLDEPLSNLDASLRLAMRSEIRSLQRKLDKKAPR
jgi:branched-chain amino acid transport system ATP-binding protein